MSYDTIRIMLERIFDVILKRHSDFTDEPLYPIPEITEEDLEAWVNAVELPEDLITQIDFSNTDGKPHKISVTLDMRYIRDISENELMRTHTSPVQARTMEAAKGAPVRVICPGKTWRRDDDDAFGKGSGISGCILGRHGGRIIPRQELPLQR